MRNLLALALTLPLAACVVGDGTDVGGGGGGGGGGGDGSGSGSGSGSGGGTGTGLSGHITSNSDWSGAVSISGNLTIDPGVTVTVAAGTTIAVKTGVLITVSGTLDMEGTSAGKITVSGDGGNWGGMSVMGTLTEKFVTSTGGNLSIFAGGTATIRNSAFSKAAGDYIVMGGGSLDMAYSRIGLEPGDQDTTHCDMHFGGSGLSIKVTHSDISTSSYGLMFYGGNNADFTYNNWFSNQTNVDMQQGSPVSGNFSNSYFQGAAPTGTGITANALSTSRLAACDGTNDATCAGIKP